MQKAHSDIQNVASTNGDGVVIHEDGTVVRDSDEGTTLHDDNASTRGIVSPHSPDSAKQSSLGDANGLAADGIPTIRVSTESDRDVDVDEHGQVQKDTGKQNGFGPKEGADALEKPVQAAAGDPEKGDEPSSPLPSQEPFSFSNKRLCERWLDNLFMVLYEVSP